MRLLVLTLPLLVSCWAGSDDDDDSGGADSDSETDPACVEVNSGDDWAWSGECPQMATPVVITVDGCELALDYDAVGGMTMGMPYSGMIDGDQVTFADDNGVEGCSGTVKDADTITGSCGDGCTYKLRR